MKNVKAHRTPAIGNSMCRLRTALEPVTTSTAAEEIAFHLAELKPELRQLHDLLDQIEKHPPITPSAMNAVLYFVDVHWPYHFNELRKLMKTRAIVRYAESDVASPVRGAAVEQGNGVNRDKSRQTKDRVQVISPENGN